MVVAAGTTAAAAATNAATTAGNPGFWNGTGASITNGAASITGSIIGANSAAKAAGASWKQQVLMAMFQRDWEKKKMQNAYQWTVEDMHKAGLNPALAYQNGSNNAGGISAGAGDTTGLQSAGQIMAKGLADIVPVASQIYSGLKGTENQTIQTETDAALKKAEAAKTIAETQNLPEKMKSEILKNIADAGKANDERNPANVIGKGLSDIVKEAQQTGRIKRKKTKQYKSAKEYMEQHKNDSYWDKLTTFKVHYGSPNKGQ